MQLPLKFCERMKKLLSDDEYYALIDSFTSAPVKGIRLNLHKLNWKRVELGMLSRIGSWSRTGI